MDLARCPDVPRHTADALEANAARYWDLFYLRNEDRFFKDRHYLDREFPLLLSCPSILEVGCGVGNTLFPLAALNPTARVHGCDFAPSAIDVVRRHPDYGGRISAHVADITKGPLQPEVEPQSMAAATLFFVLSALSPQTMPQALENLKPSLAPAGKVCIRDYARGDLAQERLSETGRAQRLGEEGFYVRWDGTRAYYFTEDFLKHLFEDTGFVTESMSCQSRLVENRKKGLKMDRLFVQGVFRLDLHEGRGNSVLSILPARVPDQPNISIQHKLSREECWGLDWLLPVMEDQLATMALAAVVHSQLDASLAQTRVLEWGSLPGSGLAAMLALKSCRWSIAVADSQQSQRLLRDNVKRNSSKVVVERLRLHMVGSGPESTAQIEQLSKAVPGQGIDMLLLSIWHLPDLEIAMKLLEAGLLRSGATVYVAIHPAIQGQTMQLLDQWVGQTEISFSKHACTLLNGRFRPQTRSDML